MHIKIYVNFDVFYMLTVKEYLIASGLNVEPGRIKLVKHVDHVGRSIRKVIADGDFDIYQAEQSKDKKVFHNCDIILSFVALENNLAEFIGAYYVRGYRDLNKKDLARMPKYMREPHKDGEARLFYELDEIEDFKGLRKRLIVQWISTRGWVQKKDLDIYEILPPVEVIPFPGYQDVLLTWQELKQIIENPRAHKDWKAALEANAGIYRIVDMTTGEIYIGSAYGNEGLWGRWSNYAKNGHGNNKLLKTRNPNNFQWSIVRTVSRSMSQHDVINVETMEKQKHGSRVHGLNDN